MANVPSGIGNLPSGIGNFSPGGYSLPGNLNLPPAGYNFLAGLPLAPGAGYASGSAPVTGPKAQPNSNGQVGVTAALMPTFAVGNPFNPMSTLDLMNLGLGSFVSPFAGSGLPGYPPATPGAGMSAPAAAAVGDALAAGAPLPRSGGKGVMG
jgi:hypothetical protein